MNLYNFFIKEINISISISADILLELNKTCYIFSLLWALSFFLQSFIQIFYILILGKLVIKSKENMYINLNVNIYKQILPQNKLTRKQRQG